MYLDLFALITNRSIPHIIFYNSCRVACNNTVCWNIFYYDTSYANDNIIPYMNTTDYVATWGYDNIVSYSWSLAIFVAYSDIMGHTKIASNSSSNNLVAN